MSGDKEENDRESPGGESKVLHRGYSVFPTKGTPLVDGPSTHTNVIIKQPLPARGVVSSNPKRVERLLQNAKENQLLTDIKTHTNVGWGVTIYTAVYKNDVEIFIAGVPMGSAGSGFAFFEMFAAGAQAIIRYGSNDRKVTLENLRELVIVDKADNIAGLCGAGGSSEVTNDTIISASEDLVNLVAQTVESHELSSTSMICHNVEDYHAYNFTDFFDKQDNIHRQIEALEDGDRCSGQAHCWDMETAALFWRAKQFGGHAATLLQNLLKKPGTSPYEGEHGKISLEMENTFYEVIFDTLCAFSPKDLPQQPVTETPATARAVRLRASADMIGDEEPLVSH